MDCSVCKSNSVSLSDRIAHCNSVRNTFFNGSSLAQPNTNGQPFSIAVCFAYTELRAFLGYL